MVVDAGLTPSAGDEALRQVESTLVPKWVDRY